MSNLFASFTTNAFVGCCLKKNPDLKKNHGIKQANIAIDTLKYAMSVRSAICIMCRNTICAINRLETISMEWSLIVKVRRSLFLTQSQHILTVLVLLHRFGQTSEVVAANPALAPSNLFEAGNLNTLAALDDIDEGGGIV